MLQRLSIAHLPYKALQRAARSCEELRAFSFFVDAARAPKIPFTVPSSLEPFYSSVPLSLIHILDAVTIMPNIFLQCERHSRKIEHEWVHNLDSAIRNTVTLVVRLGLIETLHNYAIGFCCKLESNHIREKLGSKQQYRAFHALPATPSGS